MPLITHMERGARGRKQKRTTRSGRVALRQGAVKWILGRLSPKREQPVKQPGNRLTVKPSETGADHRIRPALYPTTPGRSRGWGSCDAGDVDVDGRTGPHLSLHSALPVAQQIPPPDPFACSERQLRDRRVLRGTSPGVRTPRPSLGVACPKVDPPSEKPSTSNPSNIPLAMPCNSCPAKKHSSPPCRAQKDRGRRAVQERLKRFIQGIPLPWDDKRLLSPFLRGMAR